MEENDFKISLRHADNLYAAGKWEAAVSAASAALEAAKATGNEENSADVLNRRGWSERYVGFKTDSLDIRREMYENARRDWQEVLNISKNLKTRISAIKGLILLPDENIQQLCEKGLLEIKRNEQELENLKAEMINSQAIEIRKTDPVQASNMFVRAHEKVQPQTVIAGHLMQNAGTCWLMLLKEEKGLYQRYLFAQRAISCFEQALMEYPADQTEHRKSTQTKLDNIKKDLVRYTKEFKEEQEREKQEQTKK